MNHYILKRTISGCDKPLFVVLARDKTGDFWCWPLAYTKRPSDVREYLNGLLKHSTAGYVKIKSVEDLIVIMKTPTTFRLASRAEGECSHAHNENITNENTQQT